MDYRQLGRSGLYVSPLTLGTVTWGGQGEFAHLGSTELGEAQRMLAMCLDAGVNIIDTADFYSAGLSEQIVGKACVRHRDEIILATKAGSRVGNGPNDRGSSRYHLIRSCERSLRNLRTDYIDLFQLHVWDGLTSLDEVADALAALISSGKVRYVGASNFTGWQLVTALSATARLGPERFVSHQIYYSLEARDAETELLPAALHHGVGVLVWSPLAGGQLTGKYAGGALPEGTRFATPWHEPPVRDPERLERTVTVLKDIAAERGVTAAQVALAWLLTRPGVTSLVIGARTIPQLQDNLAAARLELSQEEIDLLAKASEQPLPYPLWHQQANAYPRLSPADRAYLPPPEPGLADPASDAPAV
jgi:aryl-alcohol dehydrogenase-like predicted oxidoreductase